MINAGLDPISQFKIYKLAELKVGKYDLSFTNASFMMLLAVALIGLWLFFGTRKRELVPGRGHLNKPYYRDLYPRYDGHERCCWVRRVQTWL